jgi:PTS system galactitol-specific IIB component
MTQGAKKVLVACGCAIATATALGEKIKKLAAAHNIPIKLELCKSIEVPNKSLTFAPDLIVVSTETPPPANPDTPYIKGIAYLTGIGEDKLNERVLEVLRS